MLTHTDREIKANRPDIIIKDKNDQRCILIDVSIMKTYKTHKSTKVLMALTNNNIYMYNNQNET